MSVSVFRWNVLMLRQHQSLMKGMKSTTIVFLLLVSTLANIVTSGPLIDNHSDSDLLNDQKVNYIGGALANYSSETLTALSNEDRMAYFTVNSRSDGIDIVSYDKWEGVWYVRENTDGVWSTTTLGAQNNGVLPLEYLVTEFGFFKLDYTSALDTSICGAAERKYEFKVLNLTNGSGLHSKVEFCAPYYTTDPVVSQSIANSKNFFSFGFHSCVQGPVGPGYFPSYRDHLITIFDNGSNHVETFSQSRYGVGQWTQCGGGGFMQDLDSTPPIVMATENMSCLDLIGNWNGGHTGAGNFARIKCVNHAKNSQVISGEHWYSPSSPGFNVGYQHPRFTTTNDSIIILDTQYDTNNNDIYTLKVVNETGFHTISANWFPRSCFESFRHLIGAPLICWDNSWDPDPLSEGKRIWNPLDNSTEYYPSEITVSSTEIWPFKAGNVGQENHWLWHNPNPIQGADMMILWSDYDLDSYHDLLDDLPVESTQYSDQDNDGYGDNPNGNNSDSCPNLFGNSSIDQFGCKDTDGDGWSDTNDIFPLTNNSWSDTDGDSYPDQGDEESVDDCPQIRGESFRNGTLGCSDVDHDGWADFEDAFITNASQWEDSDGDGYGDQLIGYQGDSCPNQFGNSIEDRFGCTDFDGDGWSDDGDDLPQEPTQWKDRDGDGYGDNPIGVNPDSFPADGTQWNDSDGDGHGDNPYGNEGDWFPNDATRWQDSDRDGIADEDDAFPNEVTQWNDTDGDGYGDEETGNRGDAFPNDVNEWADSDMDGLGNNADAFPFDPTQTEDRDGDGMGDNPMGIGADKFPDDATQWGDIDGDGFGDNPNGTEPDAFITDATQWSDADGDGYGDNPTGRLYDQFPQNPTQWADDDDDRLGDNLNGTYADPFLNDFDNDGYNDSIDILPKLPSPGDLDADGCLDANDAFPSNPQECLDSDGDGDGDNVDPDDDNDGWADTDEVRLGTNPLDSSQKPVDSFEIVIPGTSVGLGAWDLIGMFGGIPLFAWIGFGFVTRNTRCAKYEYELREANTRDELESVAYKWEYSLMLRMLGPHQGIRLERLRAELDDRFEAMNQPLSSIENNEYDQTQMVVEEMNDTEKQVPELVPKSDYPSIQDAAHKTEDNGYEWFTSQDGTNFYRPIGSQADWTKLEN
jgi:hypothetical protein